MIHEFLKENLSKTTIKISNLLINEFNGDNQNIYVYYNFPFISKSDVQYTLKLVCISSKGIICIYDSASEKIPFMKCIKHFINEIDELVERDPSEFCYYVESTNELEIKRICHQEDTLPLELVEAFNSTFSNASSLARKDERKTTNEGTIGYAISKRSHQMLRFDEEQFNYINEIPKPINVRIRGLAGSGKTIVMIRKMAVLHNLYPDMKLAYVFFTISLKQYIKQLFNETFLKICPFREPNYDNLFFFHGWGSRNTPGFYSEICNAAGIQSESLSSSYDSYDRKSFDDVCENALKQIDARLGMFDCVFIDEAQDFSLSFFKLARKSLTIGGSITYAYDELQTLKTTSGMPTPREIFGSATVKSVNLDRCYRTPNEILITAHAIGMGIYKENDPDSPRLFNIPEDISVWEAIGYKSKNKIEYGKEIELYREPVYTNSFKVKDPIVFSLFDNETDQYSYVAREIDKLIKEEDVLPEDIIIINMDSSNLEHDFYHLRLCTDEYFENCNYDVDPFELNYINKDNRVNVKINGKIPVMSIYRAKGNESEIVFVLNADELLSIQSVARNKLFTAMTRAKFRVYVCGESRLKQFEKEYDKIRENNYRLRFKYPDKDELKKIKTIAQKEEQSALNASGALKTLSEMKNRDKNAYFEVLATLIGAEEAEKILSKDKENDEK